MLDRFQKIESIVRGQRYLFRRSGTAARRVQMLRRRLTRRPRNGRESRQAPGLPKLSKTCGTRLLKVLNLARPCERRSGNIRRPACSGFTCSLRWVLEPASPTIWDLERPCRFSHCCWCFNGTT
jgi:hypothetical protein